MKNTCSRNDNRRENLKKEFYKRFGKGEKNHIFSAPGRVNLIGEHTDYNGGFVLPIAIDRNILVAARINGKDVIRFHSVNFDKTVICHLTKIVYEEKDGWANYPKAVVKILQDKGYKLKGMDLVFEGNIPMGSGLSSSAAIEVVSCLAFTLLSGIIIDRKEIPALCQKAENEFVGMRCGIMDQFIITFAKKDTALFLDCRTLKYEHILIPDSDITIVIADTKVKRNLVGSEYNTRRGQCEEGIKILGQYLNGVSQLRDVTPGQFERYKNSLPSIIRRRCEHVIYENERVVRSKELLERNKIQEFGNLMNESHESLKVLYEVSCPALDILVEVAQRIKGVLGSRMTGAGFGGCTVNLVRKDAIDEFTEKVSRGYEKKFQIKPEFYMSSIEDGAKKENSR